MYQCAIPRSSSARFMAAMCRESDRATDCEYDVILYSVESPARSNSIRQPIVLSDCSLGCPALYVASTASALLCPSRN
eukprot:1360918-Pleurochrysis_carterae.AAC.1